MQLREALDELPETVFADLLEREDAYLLVIDLPGATADTVDVQLEDGCLSISARREKSVPRSFEYLTEERSLFLDIEVPLPPDATGTDAAGEIERGVLELTLPKADGAEETTIPVE